MATLEEFLAHGNEQKAVSPYAYRIDEMMRIIQIPQSAVVIGVEGDKDTNIIDFIMPRTYKETDLSTYEIQISYVNAGGEYGFYSVGKPKVEADNIAFSWVVSEAVSRYKGAVKFAVKLYLTNADGVVTKAYNTTIGTANCLDGLDVDRVLPDAEITNLLTQFTGKINEAVDNAKSATAETLRATADSKSATAEANKAKDAAVAAANKANGAVAQLPLPTGNVLKSSATGVIAHADDAYSATALGLAVYGASTQDGTPTPVAPKPITSVASADITLSGKNLFGSPLDASGNTAEPIFLTKGTYTISLTCEKDWWTDSPNNTGIFVHSYPDNQNIRRFVFGNPAVGKRAFATADIPKDGFVKILSYGAFADGAVSDIQMELGAAATAYEPHRASSLPINLQGHELCSLPNGVRDEVRIDKDGNVELVQRLKKAVMDGSADEDWRQNGSADTHVRFYTVFQDKAFGTRYMEHVISDRFCSKNMELAERETLRLVEISLPKSIIPTADVSLLREWLAKNPTTFVYRLAAPNVIPLGKVAMPTLPAPVCNVWANDGNNPEVKINYIRDVNIAFEKLATAMNTPLR